MAFSPVVQQKSVCVATCSIFIENYITSTSICMDELFSKNRQNLFQLSFHLVRALMFKSKNKQIKLVKF